MIIIHFAYLNRPYNDASFSMSRLTCKVLSESARIIEHHSEELLRCILHFSDHKKQNKNLNIRTVYMQISRTALHFQIQ